MAKVGAPIPVGLEVARKRTFAWALDWPGWCRAGRTEADALEALRAGAPRYRSVARSAGQAFPPGGDLEFDVRLTVEGDAGTEFGVPSSIVDPDREPVDAAVAGRLADLVAAAWRAFDTVAARSPSELRTGPRGGGRDRDKMIGHVIESDHAYAREIGVRMPPPSMADRAAVETERAAMLEVLRRPSDGGPLADRRWTQRYAARRIAWHALDHAWEMEDRAVPD